MVGTASTLLDSRDWMVKFKLAEVLLTPLLELGDPRHVTLFPHKSKLSSTKALDPSPKRDSTEAP
jgi:hypothetical protein